MYVLLLLTMHAVRLGNSGLKVSKIILGTMQYGDKAWAQWVLDEESAIEHIKYAYVLVQVPLLNWRLDTGPRKFNALTRFARYEHGIQTFDTADVYSNGLSEEILGRAIKQLNLPREEIVVMTKVRGAFLVIFPSC